MPTGSVEGPTAPAPLRTGAAAVRTVPVLVIGLGTVFAVFWTPLLETPFAGGLLLLGTFAAFLLAHRWDLLRDPWFLGTWVAAGLVLAVVSASTGYLNGVTDEPYGTPGFVRIYPNLYGQPLHLHYDQYGSPSYLTSACIYLPLLPLVSVPGADYRWLTIGAWLLAVVLLRSNGASVALFGSPVAALLAAEGFNDFVPLLALTLTFVTLSGWRSRVAEVVSLGLKQFANVIVVLYFAWHRRWREAAIAVGVTVLFLLPFAVLSPGGTFCHAILLDPSPTCSGGGSASFLASGPTHLNYYVWPLWILAVFGARYVVALRGPGYAAERAAVARWRSPSAAGAPTEPIPASTLVLLPFVRLARTIRRRRTPPG